MSVVPKVLEVVVPQSAAEVQVGGELRQEASPMLPSGDLVPAGHALQP